MPQSNAAIQDPNYTPIDPKKDPLGFVSANKEAISRMPVEKQIKFVDMMFRRYALPKYQQVNKQRPLDQDEIGRLRLQFAARLLDIPFEQQTVLKDPEVKHGVGEKVGAALEAGGAGVLGGLKTIDELRDKLEKHVPIVGNYMHRENLKREGRIGELEGKAYSEAQAVSPRIADISAGIGHQIPSSIAAGAVWKLPGTAKGASLGIKTLIGAGKGAAEGATYEATRPGGDPKSGAVWGGVLGASFPMIGKLFGLGRGTTKAAEAVTAGDPGAVTASKGATGEATSVAPKAAREASTSLGDVANKVAKEKFGKPFEDLSSAEKAQMPSIMEEEIKKQSAQKAATKKAEVAAAKAGREADLAAKRAAKAKEATEKAAAQAAKRAGPSVTGAKPTVVAAKAAEENPSAAKIMSEAKQGGHAGGEVASVEELNRPGRFVKISRSGAPTDQGKVPDFNLQPGEAGYQVKPDGTWELKAGEETLATKKGVGDYSKEVFGKKVTKVPEGVEGKKVRAYGGQPASPAQQKADAERIAAKRELSKKEEFGAALEKHAQEMAGRHTSSSLGIMHVPELEATVKEMPDGEYMLKTLQKARRSYKWSDDIYAKSLEEWLLNQFEKGE